VEGSTTVAMLDGVQGMTTEHANPLLNRLWCINRLWYYLIQACAN
jgi:hypothetical protein